MARRPLGTLVHLLTALAVLAGSFVGAYAVRTGTGTGTGSSGDEEARAATSSPVRSGRASAALDAEAARRSFEPVQAPGFPGGTWASADTLDPTPGVSADDASPDVLEPRPGDDEPVPGSVPEPEPELDETPDEPAGDGPAADSGERAGDEPAGDAGDEPVGDEPVGDEPADVPGELREGPFVDPCLSGDRSDCPPGEAGTILGGGGSASAALTDGIRFTIHPYLTEAEYSDLRCDPGFVTRTAFPVVVTTNRPVTDLRLAVGPVLAEAGRWEEEAHVLDETLETDSVQAAGWLLAVALSGEPTGPGLDAGLHHCFRVPVEGVVLPATPADSERLAEAESTPLSPGETGVVEVSGTGVVHGHEATERTNFLVRGVEHLSDTRPPVALRPLDWDVLQVTVPQRDPERGHEAVAAAYVAERDDGLRGPTPPCVAATNRRDWIRAVRERAIPRPLDRDALAAPTYPYDRSYDHQAVWNLRLREGAEHEVCVWWLDGSGDLDEVEAYEVTPPNRRRVRLDLREVEIHGDRRGERLPVGSLVLRTIGLGCNRSFPDRPLELPESADRWVLRGGDTVCDSDGRRVPERLGIVAGVAPGLYEGLDPEPDGRLEATRWIETETGPVCDGVIGEPCPERVETIRVEFPERRTGSKLCGRSGLKARGDASCSQPSTSTYSAVVDVVTYEGPWSRGVSALDWDLGEPFVPASDSGLRARR